MGDVLLMFDVGSGKTLIAVLLLKHIIQQELIDRDRGKQPRISFFLVWHPLSATEEYDSDENVSYPGG